jgi:hypothetical protein
LNNKSSRVPVYVEIVKMKTKSAITALLLAFVIVSVVYLVFQQFGKQEQPAGAGGQAPVSAAPADGVTGADSRRSGQERGRGDPAGAASQEKAKGRSAAPGNGDRPSAPPRVLPNLQTTGQDTAAPAAEKYVVYYFHVTLRCITCKKIEEYSREAVEQGFSRQLREGNLAWRPVNVQLSENRHFIQDYQLFTKSVVVARFVNGERRQHKNLQRIWELVGDKTAFQKYVQDEVRAFLGGA